MQPYVRVAGYEVPISDFLFLLTSCFYALAVIFRQAHIRGDQFVWLLTFYALAMTVSAVFSTEPHASFVKLAGEFYLLSLPVLAFNLIRDRQRLQAVVMAWLLGSAVCAVIGSLSVFVFYVDRSNWMLQFTLSSFGSLPPGNYPRVMSTFLNMNMLCNYLSVSVVMLLIARMLGWISGLVFYSILAVVGLAAAFTISPGLGGIALSAGIWHWLHIRRTSPFAALLSLICGAGLAAAFLFATSVAPNRYPTAPFEINVPFLDRSVEPSSRALTWMDSWKTFTEYPLLGKGVGQDACDVRYLDLSGRDQRLTDAHNTFLSVAAQEGILGLLAVTLISAYFLRKLFPLQPLGSDIDIIRVGLSLAFVSAFIYQGLAGSFEDARHLWVLMGLIVANSEMSVNQNASKTRSRL